MSTLRKLVLDSPETSLKKFYYVPQQQLVYGIEIECESKVLVSQAILSNYDFRISRYLDSVLIGWNGKTDGSLRGNGRFEISTETPNTYTTVYSQIQDIYKTLSKYVILRNSPRTSFQVTVNTVDLFLDQYKCLVLAYLFFERMIFKLCWPLREHLVFCVPWHTSNQFLNTLGVFLSEHYHNTDYAMLSGFYHTNKYHAVNVRKLITHGSMEWRMKEGIIEAKDALLWFRFVNDFVRGSSAYFKQGHLFMIEDFEKMSNSLQDFIMLLATFGITPNLMRRNKTSYKELQKCVAPALEDIEYVMNYASIKNFRFVATAKGII